MRNGILAALAGVLAIVGPARAEVLPVSGIYPAGSDAAAGVQSISIGSFGGLEGEQLAFALEDALRSVTIRNEPYFRVLPDGGRAEAVLRGYATLSVETSTVKEKRDVCVERDKDGKCQRKEKQEVRCTRRDFSLAPAIRLVGSDGRQLYADNAAETSFDTDCPGDKSNPPSRKTVTSELIGRIVKQARADFAPQERRDTVRVLEKRDGLSKPDAERFKRALAYTKTDAVSACREWDDLVQANPDHASSLFNLALCAESAGDDANARRQYQALVGGTAGSSARERLARIADRERAARQLAAHDAN